MSITVNVNGNLKKLTRLFFNDSGVIREFNSVYIKNSNNEIKLIFKRDDFRELNPLSWYTPKIGATSSYIYDTANNGYTLDVNSIADYSTIISNERIYLPAGTLIKVDASSIDYENTNYRVHLSISLLGSCSHTATLYQREESVESSVTMEVETAGYYHLSPAIFKFMVSDYSAYATKWPVEAILNIIITQPA